MRGGGAGHTKAAPGCGRDAWPRPAAAPAAGRCAGACGAPAAAAMLSAEDQGDHRGEAVTRGDTEPAAASSAPPCWEQLLLCGCAGCACGGAASHAWRLSTVMLPSQLPIGGSLCASMCAVRQNACRNSVSTHTDTRAHTRHVGTQDTPGACVTCLSCRPALTSRWQRGAPAVAAGVAAPAPPHGASCCRGGAPCAWREHACRARTGGVAAPHGVRASAV
jgi:hypothetical protein